MPPRGPEPAVDNHRDHRSLAAVLHHQIAEVPLKNRLMLLSPITLSLFALPIHAATLCVSAQGAPGCYTRIGDAVAAAAPADVIQVGPGMYAESVVITKPLSLVADRAIIDATGLPQGVFVDGLNTQGLSSVHISGFTVQNAQLEGILVANASAVTVSSNTVLNNNTALSNGACTMLPAYEPGEQQDCGEGIHLQGVDHSIVTLNTVEGNSGGILVSDDTGATHDNLISGNMIKDNPYACGISLASHVPAALTGSAVSLGVYHNTVYGNRSMHNGYSIGGGSGIGIFASVPTSKSYGNVVVDNYVSDSGHPGIEMHAHAPMQNLNDNMVVGNTVVNNGADTADAATPGPTGINIYSLTPVTGNIIAGNSIQNESYDVGVNVPALVQVEFNNLLGLQVGVDNLGIGMVDASENWWSCGAGPGLAGSCSSVTGNAVVTGPFLTVPFSGQPNF